MSIWIPIIPFALLALYLIVIAKPRSLAGLFDRRREELEADMDRRGLSLDQRWEEMQLRYATVRLREQASAEVLRDPRAHQEIVSRLVAVEAKRLSRIERSLGRRFVSAMKASPLSDILYGDALAAVNALTISPAGRVRPIDVAAVTTIR